MEYTDLKDKFKDFKRVVYGKREDHEKFLQNCIDSKYNFTLEKRGSSVSIYTPYNKYKYVFYDYGGENAKCGYHLCKPVNKDVFNFIDRNQDYKYDMLDYQEQYFNIPNIKRYMGRQFLGYDMSACYFKIAYRKGFISKDTFNMAMKKPQEWKKGRNAAIGSLTASSCVEEYVNGEVILKETIKPEPKRAALRNHIIYEAYKLCKEVYNLIPDEFLFFLTDCFFFPYSQMHIVEKFLNDNAYNFKAHHLEFCDETDFEKKVIYWYDLDKEKPFDLQSVKYYLYSDRQTKLI